MLFIWQAARRWLQDYMTLPNLNLCIPMAHLILEILSDIGSPTTLQVRHSTCLPGVTTLAKQEIQTKLSLCLTKTPTPSYRI